MVIFLEIIEKEYVQERYPHAHNPQPKINLCKIVQPSQQQLSSCL